MEIQFDRESDTGRTPTTRLYAPTKKVEEREKKRHARAKKATETVVDEDGFRIRVRTEEIKPFQRVAMVFCGFVFAGMLVFTLSGYERITRAHADINALNNEIEVTQLRINGLDVEIECAVTIQQAQQAAADFGMKYPTQDQYVKIGSSIPITGTLPTGEAGATQTDAPVNPTPPPQASPETTPQEG